MKYKMLLSLIFLTSVQLMVKAQSPSKVVFVVSKSNKDFQHVKLKINGLTIDLDANGNIGFYDWIADDEHPEKLPETSFSYYYDLINDGNKSKFVLVGNVETTFYDGPTKDSKGKLKSIGNVPVTYTDQIIGRPHSERIKSIADFEISYYDGLNDGIKKGKIKSVGSTVIDYYSNLNDKLTYGKFKSVGNIPVFYFPAKAKDDTTGKMKKIAGRNISYDNLISEENRTREVSLKPAKGNNPPIFIALVK